MGRMSRQKGAAGEREIIALLQPIVDRVCEECGQPQIVLRRNPSQRFAAKQYDVIGVPWIALEVKRVEPPNVDVRKWWRQVKDACLPGQVPVLCHRQNRGEWRVRLRVPVLAVQTKITATVDMDWPTFTFWFEHMLKNHLKITSR